MKTRMIKVQCPHCLNAGDPYVCRMSRTQFAKGAPICPIHERTMWSDSDFVASKAMQADIRRQDAPLDICQFIAMKGGVRPTPDLIECLNKAGRTISGSYIPGGGGRLISGKAPSTLSDVFEAAIEADYFSDMAHESDLLDAIENTLLGQPYYAACDYGQAAIINHAAMCAA